MMNTTVQTATLDAAQEALTVNTITCQRLSVQLAGTFTATVTFEGTIDGTTWHTVAGHVSTVAWGGAVVSAPTAAGLWTIDCTQYRAVRARVSAYTSGTITATATRSFTVRPPAY